MVLALALGMITTLANILGAYLATLPRHPSRALVTHATAFGGGFLLAAAMLEMFPESLEKGGSTMALFVAIGYLLVYFMEQGFSVHIHQIPLYQGNAQHSEKAKNPSGGVEKFLPQSSVLLPIGTGLSTFLAFNVHDFIDGLAIGAAMVANQGLGVLVFVAVLLHEVPAGFVIATVMLASGYSARVAILSGVSIGVVTLLGIALPFLVGAVSTFAINALLALATGTFVYIGASVLIPMVETGGYKASVLSVALGFLVFIGSSGLVGLFLG